MHLAYHALLQNVRCQRDYRCRMKEPENCEPTESNPCYPTPVCEPPVYCLDNNLVCTSSLYHTSSSWVDKLLDTFINSHELLVHLQRPRRCPRGQVCKMVILSNNRFRVRCVPANPTGCPLVRCGRCPNDYGYAVTRQGCQSCSCIPVDPHPCDGLCPFPLKCVLRPGRCLGCPVTAHCEGDVRQMTYAFAKGNTRCKCINFEECILLSLVQKPMNDLDYSTQHCGGGLQANEKEQSCVVLPVKTMLGSEHEYRVVALENSTRSNLQSFTLSLVLFHLRRKHLCSAE